MGCAVYSRAEKRAAKLRLELQRLEAFMATYRELAGDDDLFSKAEPDELEADPEPNEGIEEDERVRATPQAELERIVEQVLVTHGAPLQRMELFERVKALGVIVGGRNEMANFGSKLSRAESLVNLPKLGYWPKKIPFEAGAYRPEASGYPAAV